MRTRRTNKTKRYTDYGFGLDDDGNGGEQSPGTANDDLSDDNFEAGDVDNDMSAQEDDESELDDEAVDLSDHEAPKNTPRPSKARETSRATTPAKHVIEYHKLPAYPLDPRISTRAYTGPLKRGARANILRDILYGPEFSKVKLVWELMERWTKYPVLPPRFPPQHPEGVLPSPWMPLGFELDQMKAACKWYDEYMVQSSDVPRSHPVLPKHGERLVPQAHGDVTVLLGPAENQKEYRFHQGAGKALSGSSLPVDDPENPDKGPNGWMFDVGGIVVALGWAPILTGDKQILALAVIPHSDQVKSMAEPDDITLEDEKKNGCVQFWEFEWERGEELQPRPSQKPPRFILAKCFDWGRPKRMQWCPVSFAMVGLYGILAVLCGDGRVRVVDVKAVQGSEQTSYEWLESPVATLGFTDNYNIEVTCFTWIGCNRLALGHTDGSVTLWSIYPAQMLQRHAVHASHVLDICSGYPSMPHMVASIPVGGFATLVDLSRPTGESTYVNAPGINFQPGNLDWSDHLQSWVMLAPAGGPGLNTLVLLNVRYFPLARSMLTSMSMPMCVSMRGNHPYGLVGCADGSVWGFSAIAKLFRQREEDSFKIKIFEHEFRPVDAFKTANGRLAAGDEANGLRGASRFMQGFFPEINDDPRSERLREINKMKLKDKQKTGKGKKKSRTSKKTGAGAEADVDNEGDTAGEPIDYVSAHMASRMVIHEPLTRVSATAWNPNVEFSTWAAIALGSGLVMVMDLGVE